VEREDLRSTDWERKRTKPEDTGSIRGVREGRDGFKEKP